MARIILPEQIILIRQPLNLERKVIEEFPKLARGFGLHFAGFGNGRLLPRLYSVLAPSMSRRSFPPGSASFFIWRSQSFLFDGIQQSGQFTTLFWRELVNCRFDLFHATHVQILSANKKSDKMRSIIRPLHFRPRRKANFHRPDSGSHGPAGRF
jgi:hypothetical protein